MIDRQKFKSGGNMVSKKNSNIQDAKIWDRDESTAATPYQKSGSSESSEVQMKKGKKKK